MSCTGRAENWSERKPTLPDGSSPGLAVITEGELRHQNAAPAAAVRQLADYVITARQQRRRLFDGEAMNDAGQSRRDGLEPPAVPHKRGPQSCISNCMETDNMTFVRCRFLCK